MKTSYIRFFIVGCLCFIFLLSVLPMMAQTSPYYRLRYSQIANGVSGPGRWVSTLMVSNVQSYAIHAYLEDFDHNNPMDWLDTVYTTNCTVVTGTEFIIPAYSSCRLETDGVGTLQTGWVRVTTTSSYSSDNLGGYLTYTFFSLSTGLPLSTVGVSSTPICGEFSLPVVRDAPTGLDTAWAMVNPWTYDGGTGSETMVADLYDQNGSKVASATITLDSWYHLSEFLSVRFASVLGNAKNWVGNLYVHGYSSGNDVIASTLVNRGDIYGGATVTLNDVHYSKSDRDLRKEEAPFRLVPLKKLVQSPYSPIY